MVKLIRNFTIGVIFLIVGIFAPVIPTLLVDNNDPIDVSDHRVKADISNADLKEILFLARSEYFTSVYELVLLNGTDEVLKISKSRGGVRYSRSDNFTEGVVVPPTGIITVTIGYSCGYLCGSGMSYYPPVSG
jgi:hypothetical protein